MSAVIILCVLGYAVYALVRSDFVVWRMCGYAIAIFLVIGFLCGLMVEFVYPMIDEREKRAEKSAQEERTKYEVQERSKAIARAKAKAVADDLAKEEKLRTFVLEEAPGLWRTYQGLQAELANQNTKIEELRKTLKEFGRDTDGDTDFQRICSLRDGMVGALKTMRMKMEDAYLASRKYEATPSKREYDELRRKLLEDGIQEAESAKRRFNDMRILK